MQSAIDPILVSRQAAAKALSISTRSLDYLIASGDIPTRRIGRRVLIAYADLRRYAKVDHPYSLKGAA